MLSNTKAQYPNLCRFNDLVKTHLNELAELSLTTTQLFTNNLLKSLPQSSHGDIHKEATVWVGH